MPTGCCAEKLRQDPMDALRIVGLRSGESCPEGGFEAQILRSSEEV
jgi:hypothetical protein